MSDAETKFEIEVNDEVTLARDSMIYHAEHGPMRVDSIIVSGHGNRAELKSEAGPVGLELSGDEIREQWGETMGDDPFDIHDAGSARFENREITVEGSDIEVTIRTEGPEQQAEVAHNHAIDQIVSGLQAVRDGTEPSECEGAPFEIDWKTALDNGGDGE